MTDHLTVNHLNQLLRCLPIEEFDDLIPHVTSFVHHPYHRVTNLVPNLEHLQIIDVENQFDARAEWYAFNNEDDFDRRINLPPGSIFPVSSTTPILNNENVYGHHTCIGLEVCSSSCEPTMELQKFGHHGNSNNEWREGMEYTIKDVTDDEDFLYTIYSEFDVSRQYLIEFDTFKPSTMIKKKKKFQRNPLHYGWDHSIKEDYIFQNSNAEINLVLPNEENCVIKLRTIDRFVFEVRDEHINFNQWETTV